MSSLDIFVLGFIGGIAFTLAFAAAYGIPALKRL